MWVVSCGAVCKFAVKDSLPGRTVIHSELVAVSYSPCKSSSANFNSDRRLFALQLSGKNLRTSEVRLPIVYLEDD